MAIRSSGGGCVPNRSDAHAGSVHVANDVEHALSMYGRGEFGLKVEDNLV